MFVTLQTTRPERSFEHDDKKKIENILTKIREQTERYVFTSHQLPPCTMRMMNPTVFWASQCPTVWSQW